MGSQSRSVARAVTTLAAACALVPSAGFGEEPGGQRTVADTSARRLIENIPGDAADARFVYADIERFLAAHERAQRSADRAAVYQAEYLDRANDEILVMLQIEHRDAVENLDEILAVEGYDGCFIGPTDLALSMGMPLPIQGGCQELEDLVGDLARRIAAAGKLLGTVSASTEMCRKRIEQGYRMVSLLSDLGFMRHGLLKAREEMDGHGPWPSPRD